MRADLEDMMNAISASCAALTTEVDRLLNPAHFYAHPCEVLRDRTLSAAEKRAILSSWASDSCAVESRPDLRESPGTGSAVLFDDIMEALKALDQPALAGQEADWRLKWPKASAASAMDIVRDATH